MAITARIDPANPVDLAACARAARERFFDELTAAYAAAPDVEADALELALWERTSCDGLDGEPAYRADRF
jgi:hypothetical protein